MKTNHQTANAVMKSTRTLLSTVVIILFVGSFSNQLFAQDAVLNINVSPEKSAIKIFDLNDDLVEDVILQDSVRTIRLGAGTYRLLVSKKGFESYTETFQLSANEMKEISVVLEKSSRSFFSKYKYWIIGGAVVVASSAILIFNRDNKKGPGIPVPPGRPN